MNLVALKKAIQHPDRAFEVLGYGIKRTLFWERYVAAMREPKVDGAKKLSKQDYESIAEELRENGFEVRPFHVNLSDYQEYLKVANYAQYPAYLAGGLDPRFHVRALEHYIASKLLELTADDVYIDVGSYDSPSADIYHLLFGCTVYHQDLMFPRRLEGNIIGGDAADMPVEDGFATKMALHCAFEHFEGDADSSFVRETERVLRSGGRVCIVPLYLARHYLVETDPVISSKASIPFESDAVLYCTKGYRNRHGRNYDVTHLIARIRNNLGSQRLTIYHIENPDAVHDSCSYIRFAGIIEKP